MSGPVDAAIGPEGRASLAGALAYARRVEDAAKGAEGALTILSNSEALIALPADPSWHENHHAALRVIEMIRRDLTAALSDADGETALAVARA